MEKKKRKIVEGKEENVNWKGKRHENEQRIFFFLGWSLFGTTEVGVYQNRNFYREKEHVTPGEKVTSPPPRKMFLLRLCNLQAYTLQSTQHIKLKTIMYIQAFVL